MLDPALLGPAGAPRTAFLYRCLRALDESMGGRLVVRHGDPVDVVPAVAAEAGAGAVHVSADFGPYGRRRDQAVAAALARSGRRLVGVGSPYAVDPGQVRKQDGAPFQVFSPFYRAWRAHGWPAPADGPRSSGPTASAPTASPTTRRSTPPCRRPARPRPWPAWTPSSPLDDYAEQRDRPAADATTRLSPYLKFGCIHPRTILARLGRSKSHEKLRSELAWREFYADVLWHHPESARQSLQPAMAGMQLDTGKAADERFEAWTEGRTGYPLVDAGMRQLLGEAWVHNRVRMVVASFLVKDLHIDWTRGARWFMERLVDGDLASNNHGWQWVAGTGTDPAPYFRVFNPVTQGKEHDPGRRLRAPVGAGAGAVAGGAVHEPWKQPGGVPAGYPERIVDHAAERAEALSRYESLKSGK